MATKLRESENLMVPKAAVKPHQKPWGNIAWSSDRQASIHSDWALYLSRQRSYWSALGYVNNSLALKPFDATALMRRSQMKRSKGLATEALRDCSKAEDLLLKGKSSVIKPHISMEVCNALYESNRLEDAKIKLHDHLRRFSSVQSVPVVRRLNVLAENFQDALSGETTLPVQRLIKHMTESLATQTKAPKESCDVVSLKEKEVVYLSPLEKARRQRYFRVYNETYLNRAWVDVGFLKELRNDPNVHTQHCKESSVHLKKLLEFNFKSARALTKMLHTRCPLYALHQQRYPSEAFYNKQKEDNLHRVQHQTRRNMFKILRSIRLLIRAGEQQKLTAYIEGAMGDYVTTKTHRVMPWKFEFINEVYNYLGLARINEYKIPGNLTVLQGRQRILLLFGLQLDKNRESKITQPNRPSEMSPTRGNTSDPKADFFKKKVTRLKRRMRFAEYPLERAYLLHELAQAHLDYHSFGAACSLARRALDEAVQCKSTVWSFLCLMVICKSHAILGKIEQEKEVLAEAFQLAKKMKNLDLCLFIDIWIRVVLEEMEVKRLGSNEMTPKRRDTTPRQVRGLRLAAKLAR